MGHQQMLYRVVTLFPERGMELHYKPSITEVVEKGDWTFDRIGDRRMGVSMACPACAEITVTLPFQLMKEDPLTFRETLMCPFCWASYEIKEGKVISLEGS